MVNLFVESFLLEVLGSETLLSPYLFLFVSDVLSRMILAKVQNNKVRGMRINKNCHVLSHLLFVDDFLFFMEAEEQSCQKMMDIMMDYGRALG